MAIPGDVVHRGGPASLARPLIVSRARTARRILLDRLAARLVVGGGVLIIASILAILVVIIGEAYPLFLPARAELVGTRSGAPGAVSAPSVGPIVTDEYREIAYHVTTGGELPMVSVSSGASRGVVKIPGLDGARVTAVASRSAGRHVFGTAN